MPTIRAFRALRYSSDVVPDLARVVAPPYDVIGPERQRALLGRDPRNVVRLDLPTAEAGDEPDERYRRAARLLATWRGDGTLRRDPRPSLYPYEQAYRLPGATEERVRRGIFAVLELEPFGPSSGVRPHERTLAGPKEDRYRLLRATGVNTSPVVGLYEDPRGEVAAWLEAAVTTSPDVADLVDDDGIRHRLWRVEPDDIPGRLGRSPITIADGHHRYETALRFRDERRGAATALIDNEPAPWDGILALLLEPGAGHVDVLATHRVVRDLGDEGLARLAGGLTTLFDTRSDVSAAELTGTFAPGMGSPADRSATAGTGIAGGRFGLWTRAGGVILRARPGAFLRPAGAPRRAIDELDVSRLGVALERLLGIGRDEVDAGTRIAYTKDAAEAIAWVDARTDGADAAFLLDPTPAAAILAVAADGDVMPQKSTYIYPKALTGLVINPLE